MEKTGKLTDSNGSRGICGAPPRSHYFICRGLIGRCGLRRWEMLQTIAGWFCCSIGFRKDRNRLLGCCKPIRFLVMGRGIFERCYTITSSRIWRRDERPGNGGFGSDLGCITSDEFTNSISFPLPRGFFWRVWGGCRNGYLRQSTSPRLRREGLSFCRCSR
jgi:hypothetical protein